MFFVFNKEKINSYLISVGTVVTLFVIGFIVVNDRTVQTSANVQDVNTIVKIKETTDEINNKDISNTIASSITEVETKGAIVPNEQNIINE